MRYATLALLIAFALPACSPRNAGPGEGAVFTLVNASGESVYYAAWETAYATRMDPIYSFDLGASPFPRLARGAEAPVGADAIRGYAPGRGVLLLFYAPRRDLSSKKGLANEAAVLVHTLSVTAEELRQAGGRVVVDEL